MKEKKIKVFFDGSCKVCSKEIGFYNKYDKKKKFEWIDLNSKAKDLKILGIDKKFLSKSLHIQMGDGKIVKGVNAFRIIWREYRYLKFLSYILDFKIMRIIARPIYNFLVKIK